MKKPIRIGTRDSELALWQATTVQKKLEALGHTTELVSVKSTGDLNLSQPLYEMGITGIFTKTLDIAMLAGKIDVAVHSMKDVPTSLPKGMIEAAILKRASPKDILVHKGLDFLNNQGIIASGSLRRKAQWLNKYPKHTVVDLRGNVNTRMQKLQDNNWNGAIFAEAGLDRILLKPENFLVLDWMIPAPAQGAMLVVAMENDPYLRQALSSLNHKDTEICVQMERQFLKTLEGGCTAPIGALATISEKTITFTGVLFSLDGVQKMEINKTIPFLKAKDFGKHCAEEILNQGGAALMSEIKAEIGKE